MTDSAQKSSSGWRIWLLRAAIAVLVPALVLVMVEEGLRLAKVGYSAKLLIPCTIGGKPAYGYNLFFLAPFFPPGVIKEPVSYAIPAQKPANTYRIFVLGESAAMGDPDPAYAFSRYLEVMLRQRYPSIHFEVVNTGSVAINSHISLPIAKGLAKQRPDLFIIYSGNNEVVGPYGPGTVLTASAMSIPVIRASMFFRTTRIGEFLTKIGTKKTEWRGMEMFLDKQIRADSPLMRQAYANYERNLRDTIRVARDAGARVLVSTVVTNLEDCAPFGSEHREGLTAAQLEKWTTLVKQGSQLEEAGSYADALQSYRAAEAIDNEYAELEFRIARCLSRMGNYTEAKPVFERARDLDTLRFRADSAINRINREYGSYDGAELVDAEAILSQASPHGVVGSDLVYEHVHLRPRGNYLLARAMFQQISSKLAQPAGSTAPESLVPSEADCERALALTRFDRIRMASEVLRRMEKAPFTGQLNHSQQILRLSLEANQPQQEPQITNSEYLQAISQWPNDRLLHFNYGVFLLQFNRAAAVMQLRMSRPYDGFPVFSPDGTIL